MGQAPLVATRYLLWPDSGAGCPRLVSITDWDETDDQDDSKMRMMRGWFVSLVELCSVAQAVIISSRKQTGVSMYQRGESVKW